MLTLTYAECYISAFYAVCHYAECRYAECNYAECFGAAYWATVKSMLISLL